MGNGEPVAAAPSWYKENDLKIYYAYTGTEGIMGSRLSYFVLLNGSVSSDSKVILLEANTTISINTGRYKDIYLSDGTGGYDVFIAKFDEKQNLVIFLSTSSYCELCSSMHILEGTYNAAKQTYMFTQKYGKRCH